MEPYQIAGPSSHKLTGVLVTVAPLLSQTLLISVVSLCLGKDEGGSSSAAQEEAAASGDTIYAAHLEHHVTEAESIKAM